MKKFSTLKPWLRGGLLGLVACAALFIFYIFAYFPILEKVYGERNTPTVSLFFPTITGHSLPILSSFVVPYGFLCEFSENTCSGWQAENNGNGEPWTLETGERGYCVNKIKTPTTKCADLSEKVGFIGLSVLLFGIYFAVGAGLNNFLQKNK